MARAFCGRCGKRPVVVTVRHQDLCERCERYYARKETRMTISDEDLELFKGGGSLGDHRARAEAEAERNRQLHEAHVVSSNYDDDGLAADRARAQAIGGDIVGTTRLSTWARYDKGNEQSLRVRPDGDPDVIEDYYQTDDTVAEENRRQGTPDAVSVARYAGPSVGKAGLAFPQRFA